jgi:hypothetical protein
MISQTASSIKTKKLDLAIKLLSYYLFVWEVQLSAQGRRVQGRFAM